MLGHVYIAGASARSAVESAMRAGWQVTAADLFGDSDLTRCCRAVRVSRYPDELLDVARRLPPGEWMYTGGLENYPRMVDAISRRHRLLGNRGDVLLQVRDPWRVAEALGRERLAFPPPIRRPEAGPEHLFVWKSIKGCGGTHVQLVAGDELSSKMAPTRATDMCGAERAAARERPVHDARDHYWQPYIAGTPLSAVYLAAAGRAVLLGVTRQLIGCSWSGSEGFQYTGSIGPVELDGPTAGQFRQIGSCLARHFSLRGLFGIDAVVADDRVWTIEVNPRYTASVEILERATGLKAAARHRSACLGNRIANGPASVASRLHGKAIVYARRDVVIGRDLHDGLVAQGREPGPARMADIPHADAKISRGRPVLTVFADGATAERVIQRLQKMAGRLYELLSC